MGDQDNRFSLLSLRELSGGTVEPVGSEGEIGRTLRRKYVINKLNHLNFSDGTVEMEFVHNESPSVRRIAAQPDICRGERCDFRWLGENAPQEWIAHYTLKNIRLEEHDQTVLIYPEESHLGQTGISVNLPKSAIVVPNSPAVREKAVDISAAIVQSGIRLQGELTLFSHAEFIIQTDDLDNARWIDSSREVLLLLERDAALIYSENGLVESSFNAQGKRCFVVSILQDSIRRYPSRRFRSERSEFQTSPRCRFNHPFSNRSVERKVVDLSGSGFSFRDLHNSSRLSVGTIIDDLSLVFPEYTQVRIRAQVIQRRAEEESGEVHYGLCIIDIDPQEHLVLLSLIHQAYNENSSLCKPVDLERLWGFFFDSGFIYPDKYAMLRKNKQKIRESFEKLYRERNEVARHFIYQKEDRILGHLSMVRFYERTWLLHHHASSSQGSENAGVHVLNQVGSYINDSCRFASMNLDFLMCFYRPKNHFPARVFGGLVDFVENPKVCSADEMAYWIPSSEPEAREVGSLVSMGPITEDEYIQLSCFYEEHSGGLLLDAMNLPPYADMACSNAGVQRAYRELGIERTIEVIALRHTERLVAVVVVNRSDPGINLSELTNSCTCFLLQPEYVTKEMLQRCMRNLAIDQESAPPMLLFPLESADKLNVHYEKSYTAWVMDTEIGDSYFDHIQSLLRKVQS